LSEPYAAAMLDWLACGARGLSEPAARAAAELGDPLLAAGVAGHVLDFDDTWTPGLAHLTAATAPPALFAVAERSGTVGDALAAYARGFETMAALAEHGHPAIYARGLHPTAATGVVGAAVAWASASGDPGAGEMASAIGLALTRSGGLLASFGGDGKSAGVGGAVVGGRDAARLARAGATADLGPVLAGICRVWDTEPLDPDVLFARASGEEPGRAIADNWIKAYPCCLQTHSAIEAALTVDATRARAGSLRLRVHPISLEAAAVTRPRTGMEAKFSIPYLAAWALVHGRPTVESFDAVDQDVLGAAERLIVEADATLDQSEAVLDRDGYELARVVEALGSPSRPMSKAELEEKVRTLAGPGLVGVLDDPERPAAEVLAAAELG
jgi:2-methylcitrate dehydratase PrpD